MRVEEPAALAVRVVAAEVAQVAAPAPGNRSRAFRSFPSNTSHSSGKSIFRNLLSRTRCVSAAKSTESSRMS